jgi:hypothetical protein
MCWRFRRLLTETVHLSVCVDKPMTSRADREGLVVECRRVVSLRSTARPFESELFAAEIEVRGNFRIRR